MSAEIDHFRLKRNGDDILVKTALVPPGEIEPVDFFGPKIKLLISCGIDNLSATAMFLGRNRGLRSIQAVIYKNEDDHEGEEVSIQNGKIKIEKPQELQLIFSGWRYYPIKILDICFSSEGGVREEVPQKTEPLLV